MPQLFYFFFGQLLFFLALAFPHATLSPCPFSSLPRLFLSRITPLPTFFCSSPQNFKSAYYVFHFLFLLCQSLACLIVFQGYGGGGVYIDGASSTMSMTACTITSNTVTVGAALSEAFLKIALSALVTTSTTKPPSVSCFNHRLDLLSRPSATIITIMLLLLRSTLMTCSTSE
jgi:hypothetical protein